MVKLIRTDLDFILQQIKFAEQHAAGADLRSLFPNSEIAWGLRTLSGSFNNLVPGQSQFGAADTIFPRLLPPSWRNDLDGDSFDPDGPGPAPLITNTDYNTSGSVADADPRLISNLIVDQTASNMAAYARGYDPGLNGVLDFDAWTNPLSDDVLKDGVRVVDGTRADGTPFKTFEFANVTADAGLSAPFNAWMTFFGQFFDHGLDLVTKGGNGTVYIPLQPDDPLYVPGGHTNFMAVTRATQFGAPGLNENTTSPFVDQNQTYSSHPSHQVFLREYVREGGLTIATGRLIEGHGAGGAGGGMATWADVKAQARDLLGIQLTDMDVFNVPLLRTDQYGKFIPGPTGYAQIITGAGPDGVFNTGDDIVIQGDPTANGGLGASLVTAVRTGHAFLNDIAHNAEPGTMFDPDGPLGPLGDQVVGPDGDTDAGNAIGVDFRGRKIAYDDELLDRHFIAGDGRVNENIGLTAVHAIFHSEHNRLVEHIKSQVLADAAALLAGGATQAQAVAFLNEWLRVDVATVPAPADFATLQWEGERLFQAAKFGTEMQYQHLVFEEFARTIQPNVDAFLDFNDTINPAIVAEFAHTVYRFGHSMLTETVDRYDGNFDLVPGSTNQIGLIQAFLNPLAFAASGADSDLATAAIIRGLTRQVGNEIDEFVTEALRNNLVGLPLDLPAINIARGRDAGIPSLNQARATFYAGTGDSQLKPYTSWVDFAQHLKHPASLINFIAAYGTHSTITSATTLVDKRSAAAVLVLGGIAEPADRMDFLNATGAFAGGSLGGLNDVDFWIGGLAEEKMPFGGMLGSTFNFVFETQLEALQDGDRLYYLHRLNGLNFLTQLENNSFSDLIMRNTGLKHLPALAFSTPGLTLEVDILKQFNANVMNGGVPTPREDPDGDSVLLTPLVIRDNPNTVGPDSNYLQYTGDQHIVLGGTDSNDILISSEGDDTVYGDGGNDRIEGGYGNDDLQGGDGDDIITDIGGDDVIKGGDGNDVIHGGQGLNLIISGRGNDFIITGEDSSEVFAGEGNDFILGSKLNVQMMGGEGDDWFEIGTQDGAPGDNFDPFGADDILGNDVFIGDGGFDEMIGEGGDDIMVGSGGPDKFKGMSGFDWVTYKNEIFGVNVEMLGDAFNEVPLAISAAAVMNRFREIEGLSGSSHSDILRGDNADAAQILTAGLKGSVLTNFDLVTGLRALVDGMLGAGQVSFGVGNIILGGAGADWIEGRAGDDLIDGDAWLNVRISVTGGPMAGASFDSMTQMIPLMMNGTINPGDLAIVREILTGADHFDTAVFSGNFIEYEITDLGGGLLRVRDTIVGRDGTDTLRSVERLQFADQTDVRVLGLNAEAVGQPTITDTNGGAIQVGDVLRASIAGVTDADNVTLANPTGAVSGAVAYYWQVETVPGSGVFNDILDAGGVPIASPTLTVDGALEGLSLRVRAIYTDGHQVIESVNSAATAAVAAGAAAAAPAPVDMTVSAPSAGVRFIRSDLQFFLDQIAIAEADAVPGGPSLNELIPNSRVSQGLRTVTGEFNNLQNGRNEFGAADNIFPRLTDPKFLDPYNSTGMVVDSQPRTISNLIVDQTANNPVAYATGYDPGLNGVLDYDAWTNPLSDDVLKDGVRVIDGMRADGTPFKTFEFANTSPDVGLSAPFNAWMTFFGQFFDHGLDLVTKGGNSIVFIPLKPDDPLFSTAPGAANFMTVTRATQFGGPGLNENTTSPFVDQNQTYSSHPSHQVFLREYVREGGVTLATGRLIEGASGGMANWGEVKAQALTMLGIRLTDADIASSVPLLATDAYGKFIPGDNGYAQVVVRLSNGTEVLVSGTAAGLDLSNPLPGETGEVVVRTGHAFLNDIAHTANPVFSAPGVLAPDADLIAGNPVANDGMGHNLEYDDELLNAHFIAGDGRVNENIGLTAVHAIFHSEHNRLVEHIKSVALNTDVAFLNQWLRTPVATMPTTQAEIDALQWNGERLFQAAKVGTEMQYQHLVFEEFARTIQPNIDVFTGPTQGYDVNINPAIVAEFAHTVYRFGHSMLTETVDRFDPDFSLIGSPPTEDTAQIGLIQAFLNPLAFTASGATSDEAAGAIVRGVTRQVGNEIDEFVTEALRNNLVGLPLDLPAINIARGRDTGIPSLNAARRDFFAQTGDSQLRPYTSWADFVQYIKHPASLINFIAAYGTHSALLAADVNTAAEKRAVATALVLGGTATINAGGVGGPERIFDADAIPGDRIAFLYSTGIYANLANGVTTTGVDAIDLWIGGLAEEKMPFGGMLGSTFNFVFETQLEALQFGDRLYYLDRLAGQNFVVELENNSFAKLIMANTNAKHLPGLVFSTPAFTLEVDPSQQHTGLGVSGRDDPSNGDPLLPLVIRDNPDTAGPDTNYLEYTGEDHVVLGGTNNADIMISGDGDDTIWGDGGNDRIEGGYGNDMIRAGDGDDIISDIGGDDNIQGDGGNDVIQGGNGLNLILGGFGQDFIITGEDSSESFGGVGNDFILGSTRDEQNMGGEGNDWIESGSSDGSPGDNFDPNGRDLIAGHDVFIGDGMPNIMNAEGGDDILVGSAGPGDKYLGASGFDWATFKDDTLGVNADLRLRAFITLPIAPSAANVLARFESIQGLSGSRFADILVGDDETSLTLPTSGAQGSVLNQEGITLINGLQALLNTALGGVVTSFAAGNIILGGDGSDVITGNAGDDIIDGDKWLNVRIAVTGGPMAGASFDSMVPMVPLMLNGTINPGDLTIVREILDLPAFAAPDFDTAVFTSALFTAGVANYEIRVNGVLQNLGAGPVALPITVNNGDVVTVRDITVRGFDGTDTLINIERLQFADQSIVIAGLNAPPTGSFSISDSTPTEDQVLTVSIAGIFDANNVSPTNPTGAVTGPVAYFWQWEVRPGVWEDILRVQGGEDTPVSGPTFTPGDDEVGVALRVRAIYQDGNGVLEEVFSVPTAPVANVNDAPIGAPTLSDQNPTQDIPLQALTGGIVDPDGLTTAVFSYQWQVTSTPAVEASWANIPGLLGTEASFTPRAVDVNRFIRVVVTYTDDQGTTETVTSAPSGAIGFHTIDGNLGNVVLGGTFDDWLQGNGGNDTLIGNAGADLLDGGANNDTLVGGAGADTMIGGLGNDTFVVEDLGDIVIELVGGGADNVQTSLLTYTLADNVENLSILAGSTGNRVWTGNILNNVITSNGGADTLDGGDGNDTLNGGDGNDILFGGLGADTLNGGANNDTLTGGADNDALNGGAGDDRIVATVNDGNDVISGGANVDTYDLSGTTAGATVTTGAATSTQIGLDTLAGIENIIGSQGSDSITVNGGVNTIDGQAGDDVIDAGGGADIVFGGLGKDTITGGAGADTLDGGSDDDTFLYTIGAGADTVIGGAGDDLLRILGVNPTNETLTVVFNGVSLTNFQGGTITGVERVTADLQGNSDTLSYVGTLAAVSINLGAGTASGFTSIANISNAVGGGGNDTLTGALGVTNVLTGGAGDDTFFVHDTTDVVSEANLLVGGVDTVNSFATTYTIADADVENLTFVGVGNFTGTGNASANTITGGAGGDILNGGGGADRLIGGAGNDALTGGGGVDTAVFSGPVGSYGFALSGANLVVTDNRAGSPDGADTLIGFNNETLEFAGQSFTLRQGTNAVQTLNGGAGADLILGFDGNDTLNGAGGNDRLIGGNGNDTMNGGLGNDTFVFAPGAGNDTINGFDEGLGVDHDLLDVSALGATSFADVTVLQVGGNVVLTVAGQTITLNGELAANITADDFIFGP